MACSMRMLMEEIRRWVACSGGVSSPPRGVFFGWTIVMPGRTKPWWQGIACQLCHALISGLSFTGVAQAAHMTGLGDHEEVFDRVALFLAAVVCLLFLRIGRAMDRSLRAIMPKRGG